MMLIFVWKVIRHFTKKNNNPKDFTFHFPLSQCLSTPSVFAAFCSNSVSCFRSRCLSHRVDAISTVAAPKNDARTGLSPQFMPTNWYQTFVFHLWMLSTLVVPNWGSHFLPVCQTPSFSFKWWQVRTMLNLLNISDLFDSSEQIWIRFAFGNPHWSHSNKIKVWP